MGWFTRKKKEKTKEVEKVESTVSVEESIKKAEELKEELKNCDETKKVMLLNEIGGIYYKISDYDNAVIYYEESLNIEKTIGKAYTNLLNIYNVKRKEAAVNKDDDMMKISKDVVRGNV